MKKRAADILVEILEAQETTYVFGVPGESYLAVLDGLYDSKQIEFVNARHESGASFMAEAYGKLEGKAGIAMVTRGPGATHASIGVHTAHQNSTPMILFIGQIARDQRDREAFQEVDYRAFFGDIAKWVVEVDDPARMSELLHRAFHVAQSGRPGPVIVSLPEDILEAEVEASAPKKISRIEAGMDAGDLAKVSEYLGKAKKPLIVAGGGGWSDAGRAALQAFAVANKIPVVAAFRCQDIIDNNEEVFVGDGGLGKPPYMKQAWVDADLVLAVNIRFGEILTDGWSWATPPNYPTKLVHIHSDAAELGKIYQGDLHIHAGVNRAAEALAGISGFNFGDWVTNLHGDFVSSRKPLKTKGSVNVAEICTELNDLADPDAIFTNGAGNFAIYPGRYIRFGKGRRLIAPQSGAMGAGVPAAMAVATAYPNRQVICFAGDGDFQMSLQELGTALQYGLKPMIFVHNNGTYGTIRMHQDLHYPKRQSGTALINPDFEQIANAYDFAYFRIEASSEFKSVFERAKSSGKACLIEMVTDPDDLAPGKIAK